MQRYHLRCPSCGARIPLFGDEPDDPCPDMTCDECGTIFFYQPHDLIPDQPPRRINRIDEHPSDFAPPDEDPEYD